MGNVRGALIATLAVAVLAGCGATPASTPASPSPGRSAEQALPSASLAADPCAKLTAADVTAAIAALPGWSYDYWSTGWRIDGDPQPGGHTSAEYIAPDRLRDVAFGDGIRHGTIIIGDRTWTYPGVPESPYSTPAFVASLASPAVFDVHRFPTWLDLVFPLKGMYREPDFPFGGDLPGDGLRESPRVADSECLATDQSTGTSLVTTRSGQLVRMTSEKRDGQFIEQKVLSFRATMPPPIEAPSEADLFSTPFSPHPARSGRTGPR